MKIDVTLGTISNQQFISAMNKILNAEIPVASAYNLMRVQKKINSELETYKEKFDLILKKYAKKDDNGNIVYVDDRSSFQIMDLESAQNDINELNAMPFSFEFDKLDVNMLSNLKLSVLDIAALDGIIITA